jgi:hypothetical protein
MSEDEQDMNKKAGVEDVGEDEASTILFLFIF